MRCRPRRPWSQSAGRRRRRWRQHRRTIRSPAARHRDAGQPQHRNREDDHRDEDHRLTGASALLIERRLAALVGHRGQASDTRAGDRTPPELSNHQSRVAYLRFLRPERKQSPRSEADADFQQAKTELIRLRIAEKQRHLIPLEEAVGHMDELVGLFLTRLSGFAARCGSRDLTVRRFAGFLDRSMATVSAIVLVPMATR